MSVNFDELTQHDSSDDCPVCGAHEIVAMALIPAAAAWESSDDLPRFSIALHGAAGLLGVMLAEGIPRQDIEAALGTVLDDIESHRLENGALGGPTQGSA